MSAPNPCPHFRFSHREKPKTRTSRILSNSSKKGVSKYVFMIIIHRTSRKINRVQFSSGPRNQCPRFRFRIEQNLKRGHRGQLSNSSLDLAVWIYGFLDQGKSALPEVSTRSPFNPGNFWYKQDMCSE